MASELNANDINSMLRAWSGGDESALNGLTPIVYTELRRLAHYYMERERPGHTLQTTALVNEAYMRLVDYKRMQWQDRAHFFAVAAQAMRRILVDHARSHNIKRGAGVPHIALDDVAVVIADRATEPDADFAARMSQAAAEKARGYTWAFAAARLRRVYADLAARDRVICK